MNSSVPLILTTVGLLSAGQVLFKLASFSLPKTLNLANLVAAAFNPYFVVAIVVYLTATVAWLLVLRDVDLSRAYPFFALSFVIVPICGILLFGESASIGLLVGTCLIVAGVGVIALYS